MQYAIVLSRFNKEITDGLLTGAEEYLVGKRISKVEVFHAPGTFEIPLIAQKLAQTKKYAGIICLGAVIKGETAHFEFISLGTTVGMMQAMLQTGVPISFGILTTYTDDQAQARSSADSYNKGQEAAAACVETVETLLAIEANR